MFKQLNMLTEIYGVPINTVIYHQHGYDDDTVQFALVNTLDLSYGVLLKDMNDWGMSGLSIDENDYVCEPLEIVFWVVGGASEMIMFNLKYKSDVIIALNYEQMMKSMSHARKTVIRSGKITWTDGVDYMNVLGNEADIRSAYERYCGKGRP